MKTPTVVIGGKELTYRALTFDDIVTWCKENNQVQWLKDKVHEEVNGRKISYIEVKRDFAITFLPEIAPKKNNKKSMLDIVDAL